MRSIVFVVLLLLPASLLSQTKELLSFHGISFGINESSAKKAMLAKGAVLLKRKSGVTTFLDFGKFSIYGMKPKFAILGFSKEKLFTGTFLFFCDSPSEAYDVYSALKDSVDGEWSSYIDFTSDYYIKQYTYPDLVKKHFAKFPNESWAVTLYEVPRITNTCSIADIKNNAISLSFQRDLTVVLRYKDFCLLEASK